MPAKRSSSRTPRQDKTSEAKAPRTVSEAVHAYRLGRVARTAVRRGRLIAAGEFKPVCLALMDDVARTQREVVITKRNKPVARLVPVLDPSPTPFIGRATGVIEAVGDLVAPIGEDWEVGADL